jgi:ABC-type multidrug transport system fused ATPase/permease subunit
MIARLDHDVNSVSLFFARFWSGIVVALLSLCGSLLIILWEAPLLSAILAASTALALLGLLRFKDVTTPNLTAEMAKSADFFSTMKEHFSAAEDIRANGALAYTFARFTKTLAGFKTAHRNAYLAHSGMWGMMQLAFALNTVISFAFCYYYWQLGQMQVGTAFMLVLYNEQLRHPINEVSTRLRDLQRAEAAIVRLNETLAVKPAILDAGVTPLPAQAPELRFNKVTFGYEPGQVVLNDMEFVIPPGEVLGLLGRTGSGKSSLARLLMRFYEPQSGSITLDAIPLQEFSLKELRRNIAFVTQEVQLFRTSLRDNLTFFDSAISDSTILAALNELGLSDWLAELPQGLDSVLGDEFGLSAGESQLLALTRAFLRRPALVILDEASARLDPVTERRLSQAIQGLLKGRTAIIIAHRLHTLEQVDKILVLERGSIVEFGDYRNLREDASSHFAQLLQQQEMQGGLVHERS